jgi:arsenate reductase-like glutaredoxin family protein
MKITVYTITDCPFCKQEKEFLTAQGLQFEEKNVQENRQFLTEMLDVSGLLMVFNCFYWQNTGKEQKNNDLPNLLHRR